MGILTLLRNAFGRSRKGRTAEAEGADRTPTQSASPQPTTPTTRTNPQIPDPRPATDDGEHDLVAAAFDNVTVPKQNAAAETEPKAAETGAGAPEPVAVAETPEPVGEPEPKPAAETPEPEPVIEPKSGPTPEPTAGAETPEPVGEPEPKPAAETPEPAVETPEPEPTSEPEQAVESEPVAVETPEPEPVIEPKSGPTSEPELVAETPEPVVEAEPKLVAEAKAEPAAAVEPEPVIKPEPEPTSEPEQAVESEPVAGAETPESEPVAGAQTPEPVIEPESQPTTESEPVAGAVAEPVAVVEPEPVIEPVVEPEPVAEAPAVADGEGAPQGPPAPGDESSTGGAGGNETAEGEAEDAPTPAVTLTQLKTRAPSLTTAYKAATTPLTKNNLTGTRAKIHLVLDRSASMRPYYKDGSAQALAEQTLALAAHLDPEATVSVTFFSTELDGTGELTLTDHENKIDDLHAALGRMGRTSYHVAVEEVVTTHQKTAPDTPALVIFQTDGAPDAKTPATQALTDAAKNHPHIHFAFVAFGEHDNKAFDYLRKLKTGNTSFFHAGPTPRELTDTELYTGVLENWRP